MITIVRHKSKRQLISLTPLIDVVFILLVFFMLASSFLDWHRIDLKLAGGDAANKLSPKPIAVFIDSDAHVWLEGTRYPDLEFVRVIGARLSDGANLSVRIRTADDVPLQRAVDVVEMISAAGGKDVSFARNKGAGG